MPSMNEFSANLVYHNVTIASGGTTSSAIDLYGTTLVGIFMPASWTAANLTLKASSDNSTFEDVYDSAGTQKTLTVAASRYVMLDPSHYAGIRHLKLVSSATQGADRVITLAVRPV
ncbi:MAG: hypothetical protein IT567_06690 [Alphaproteobacteria bacterium]|nr:hypothetical protein [Alphaproteobacteria bacterium]